MRDESYFAIITWPVQESLDRLGERWYNICCNIKIKQIAASYREPGKNYAYFILWAHPTVAAAKTKIEGKAEVLSISGFETTLGVLYPDMAAGLNAQGLIAAVKGDVDDTFSYNTAYPYFMFYDNAWIVCVQARQGDAVSSSTRVFIYDNGVFSQNAADMY